ncbi:sensor histidine kinase [Chitinibacter bivalviorum]|uniref:histidine kinase n=1 Tax=Chitinibacter bivalviorum TaxID=2739434 RepID=A0A7H9BFS2_9NEIS|nr:sensor histidine kinase [Chitinibacter bivalviorum]QLG87560.1 sensor histidine kinase [Chitinibacter bivalviorum]
MKNNNHWQRMQVTKRSLQRQLLLWTVLPLLVLWLAGAGIIYAVSLHYASENNDAHLSRLADTLAAQVIKAARHESASTAESINAAAQLLLKSGPEGQLHYAIQFGDRKSVIGSAIAPFKTTPSDQNRQIFSDISLENRPYRLLSAYYAANHAENQPEVIVEVAKDLSAQTATLNQYMLRMALPLVAMMLLISVIIWFGVKSSLKPLVLLKQMVETRQAQDLSPLVLENAPEELNALSDALNQLLASTEGSVNRQRRFIADAAHQLRTPLAGLKSQTELAMRESNPEGLRDRLNMVHTSATRSIHLVNQLLTLARSEPGSPNGIPKVKMDLARLIRDLTGELVPRALAARIDLGCDCLVQEAWIDGNSALLRELFINLVENAIKYIPRDGSVTVRLTETATQYVVDVEDNGPGIPDADKQRVFERFFRREQTGNGCGLGMAIVREIVERHSGTVELLDAEPNGLIVHVVLPKNLFIA